MPKNLVDRGKSINFARVFHGIRFKVRGLVVGMTINLFFIPLIK